MPFDYLVAVVVRGEDLVVAEAFFPDTVAKEERLDAIRGALEGWKP